MNSESAHVSVPAVSMSPNTAAEMEVDFPGSDQPERYGLALSGGGIRATLFHYGALRRINDMGHLREIDRIVGVSGGAIATGFLAKVWDELEWDDQGRSSNLEAKLEPLVMRLAGMPIDIPLVAFGLIPFVSPSKWLARILDVFFFRGLKLEDIPPERGERPRPRFVFNASDLATGTLFRFSEPYMGTYRVGLVMKPRNIKVATAVAASASFPPLVSPLNLDMNPDDVIKTRGADLHHRRDLRRRAALVDGGAYDNLALEPITDRCDRYLVSDAGGNIKLQPPTWKWWFWTLQVLRTLDIAVSQDRALRRSALSITKTDHPYALWRTLSVPATRKVVTPYEVNAGWPAYLSTRSTRLWPFSQRDRRWLVNWGYVTSDVMLRSWIWEGAAAPGEGDLPFPDATFAQPPPESPDLATEPDPSALRG
jgi:NTE family protein